jgi:hypothetical protein
MRGCIRIDSLWGGDDAEGRAEGTATPRCGCREPCACASQKPPRPALGQAAHRSARARSPRVPQTTRRSRHAARSRNGQSREKTIKLGIGRDIDRDARQILGPRRATLVRYPQALCQEKLELIAQPLEAQVRAGPP